MKLYRSIASIALGILAGTCLLGQEEKPPHAVPSDEHTFLHQFVGEWKTNGKGTDLAGKSVDMLGYDYDRMVLGDFWLFFVYNSQINGKPFIGHGMIGYDPSRKKYMGTWVDSMSPYMSSFEGTADAKKNEMVLDVVGVDPATEKSCKGRLVFQFEDPDHRSLQSFAMDDPAAPRLLFDLHYVRIPSPK